MGQLHFASTFRLLLIAATLLATTGTAIADKPEWAGGGHREKQKQHDGRDYRQNRRDYDGDRSYRDRDRRDDSRDRYRVRQGGYFIDRHRTYVHDFYHDHYRGGRCPPGLAKKRNGCLPPGQAKRWAIGRPLPRDVVFYDLPPAVIAGFGPPPPGYRFVRVASDILMIAIGTGLVMDAIHDLGGGWR